MDVSHEIEEGMVHVYQALATFVPECEPAILRIGSFVRNHARAGGATRFDVLRKQSRTARGGVRE